MKGDGAPIERSTAPSPDESPMQHCDDARKSLTKLGLLVLGISIVLHDESSADAGKYDNQLAGEPTHMPAPAAPFL
jgi:hypothetical protein